MKVLQGPTDVERIETQTKASSSGNFPSLFLTYSSVLGATASMRLKPMPTTPEEFHLILMPWQDGPQALDLGFLMGRWLG